MIDRHDSYAGVDRPAQAHGPSVGDALTLAAAHLRNLHVVSRADCWRCNRASADTRRPAPSDSAAAAGARRVAVMADDADLAGVLTDLLREFGYAGLEVSPGDYMADALAFAEPMMAVVEVGHSGSAGDALEALTSGRALRSVPVLLYGSDPSRLESLVAARQAHGPTRALTMPFEIDDFLERMDGLLEASGREPS